MGARMDRIISALSPTAGERRARARLRMKAIEAAAMHFDGASAGSRTQGWRRVGGDANVVAVGKLGRLRDTARDMVRNDPMARRIKEVVVNNVVGAGIIPQAKAKTPEATKRYEDLMVRHFDTTAIDAAGRHDLYGLQRLAKGAVVESGEVLLRRRRRRPTDGLPLPFQIQVLEADFLDDSKDGPMGGGNYAIQGVEFDALGRRVAYWLYDSHPAGAGYKIPTSRRVPAEDVAHIYRMDRPGQVRGVTWLASVMLLMNDFRDYKDAQLVRQKIAACFAVFEEDADANGPSPLQTTDTSGETYDSLAPGMYARLAPGRSVKFADPPGVEGYADYIRAQQRDIAAGVGIAAFALTGDLSEINFSSGRLGWLETQRNVDVWQQDLITQGCRVIERWFLEACAVSGLAVPVTVTWTPPRREMIDPTKEVPAYRDAIRAGQETPSSVIRKLGRDPAEFFAELAEDFKTLDDLGLTLDCDPRKVSRAGLTQARPQGSVLPDNSEEQE